MVLLTIIFLIFAIPISPAFLMGYLPYIAQSEQEAWAAFLVACSTSDKKSWTDKEAMRIAQLRFRSGILPRPMDDRIFMSVWSIGFDSGAIALIDGSIERIHKDDYRTLFTYCCEILYAHGEPCKKKQAICCYIAKVLKVGIEFFKVCIEYQRAHSLKDDGYLGKR